jgi:hypothetical protein
MADRPTLRQIVLAVAVIVGGTLAPSFVRCVLPVYDSAENISVIHAAFSLNAKNATLWGLHAIPLIISTYILLYFLPKERDAKGKNALPKTSVIGAFLFLLAFMLVLNVSVQTPPFGSTDAIAYFLLPFTGLIVACLGFVCGMGISALMGRADER